MKRTASKLFAITLALCIVFTSTFVSAAVRPTISYEFTASENDVISVDGNISFGANEHLTFLFVQQGTNPMTDEILVTLQTESKQDGSFTFQFMMPKDEEGNTLEGLFIAYVGCEYLEQAVEKEFIYFNKTTTQKFLDSVEACADGDELFDDVLENEDNADILAYGFEGLLWEEYADLDEKKELAAGLIFNHLPDTITEKSFVDSFNIGVSLGMLEISKTDIEKFKNACLQYGSYLNVDFSKADDITFENLKASDCFDNISDLGKKVDELMVISSINQAQYSMLTEIITKPENAAKLGIADKEYYLKYLDLDYKSDVNKEITLRASRSPFTDASDFASCFADIMTNYANEKDYSNVSTGGGNGGGNGGNKGGNVISTTIMPTVGTDKQETGVVAPAEDYSFSDVPVHHWAYEEITQFSKGKIINGFADKTFRPDAFITREQFTKIIMEAFGIKDAEAKSTFDDVNEKDWYYRYVSSAYDMGIVKGIGENRFGVGENITRQDAAVILKRCLDKTNVTIHQTDKKSDFKDKSSISDYANESIELLYSAGIIQGMEDGTFEPMAYITRAQATKMIFRSISK